MMKTAKGLKKCKHLFELNKAGKTFEIQKCRYCGFLQKLKYDKI